MRIPGQTQTSTFIEAIREIASDFLQLFPLAAFLFVSCVPNQSLAFAELVEQPREPLLFERNTDLAGMAIMGIDAFPEHSYHSSVLSQVPIATMDLAPGATIRAVATAYSSTPGQTDANPYCTASGTIVHSGTLAANFLPLGSVVRVNGIQYTVEDRLSSRYNDKFIVDVWQPTLDDALQFGVRFVDLEVVALPD